MKWAWNRSIWRYKSFQTFKKICSEWIKNREKNMKIILLIQNNRKDGVTMNYKEITSEIVLTKNSKSGMWGK